MVIIGSVAVNPANGARLGKGEGHELSEGKKCCKSQKFHTSNSKSFLVQKISQCMSAGRTAKEDPISNRISG